MRWTSERFRFIFHYISSWGFNFRPATSHVSICLRPQLRSAHPCSIYYFRHFRFKSRSNYNSSYSYYTTPCTQETFFLVRLDCIGLPYLVSNSKKSFCVLFVCKLHLLECHCWESCCCGSWCCWWFIRTSWVERPECWRWYCRRFGTLSFT